jgi:VWFA-related protein
MQSSGISSIIRMLAGAILGLLLVARGMPPQAQGPQLPTIRVETKQVLVPVVVTDHKGHYIKNLTAADFRIYDDDVEQRIVALNTQTGGASSYFQPQLVELGPPLPATLTLPSEGKGLPPSTYLICLDTLNSAFSGYAQVRRALEKLFKAQPTSDAQYGLVTLSRQARITQNLTRNPATILAALNSSELTGAITQSETSRRAEEETELAQMLNRYCGSCACSGQDNPASKSNPVLCRGDWQSIEGWAAAQSEQRRVVTVDFLNNLRGLVERLGEVPGKRTIIFVSDGFNNQPGRELYGLMAAYTGAQGVLVDNTAQNVEPELRQVVRAAQIRDVSFYTVDSRGVYIVSGFEINQTVVDPFPGQQRVTGSNLGPTHANVQLDRQTVATDNQSALQELAADTGGNFFHNSNDFLKGLRQALDDGEAYYLLAYTPTYLIADGKFHRIKVEVDQKNVVIRAKKGYYAPAVPQGPRLASIPPVQVQTQATVSTVPSQPSDAAASQGGRESNSVALPGSNAAAPRPVAVNNSPGVRATGTAKEVHPAPVLMVDWPLAQLMRGIPQLQELKPVESQEELPEILAKVGKNVETFVQSVTNLASNEDVTEEQLKPDGKVSKQFKEKFDYLVVAQTEPKKMSLREYRTDADGKPVNPAGLAKGYMVTSGDFSAALCFLPTLQAESSFRYLGDQVLDGRKTFVVVFAQRSGWGKPIGLLQSAKGEKSVATFLQGIAWVDSTNYQIVRLRTDVGPPRLDAGTWRLTSDIHYHEVHFQQLASSLWMPDNVVVTMSLSDRMWRNEHHYSGFKLFTVDSKPGSELFQ